MAYANNKSADPRSLISTIVVRCLDRLTCILAISNVARFWLASVAEQAGLNVTWSQTLEDTFSLDGSQIMQEVEDKQKEEFEYLTI